MSYKIHDTGDLTNNYITRLSDFIQLAPNLLNSKTSEEFEIWYEKLDMIDRRSLFLYIRKNIKKIPNGFLNIVLMNVKNIY